MDRQEKENRLKLPKENALRSEHLKSVHTFVFSWDLLISNNIRVILSSATVPRKKVNRLITDTRAKNMIFSTQTNRFTFHYMKMRK